MRTISFYSPELAEVARHQKAVFDHFGLEIEQVCVGMSQDNAHGKAIDNWLQNSEWDSVAIFDIDCIPLNKHVLLNAQSAISDKCVYGAAQKANHISGSEIYVSPAFCCFTRGLYEAVMGITFMSTQWHDVGGFFSSEAKRVGAELRMLWPIEVENPIWDLHDGIKFGHGTNYQNQVYHAFESRFGHESTSRFIEKCKEVINA